MRKAFFGTYADDSCEYVLHADVEKRVQAGEKVVSATFVTPYPPGFPVLVPGQVVTMDVLEFMASLDTPEVHGYEAEVGYRVYRPRALPGADAPTLSGGRAVSSSDSDADDSGSEDVVAAVADSAPRASRSRSRAGAKTNGDSK